MPALTSERPKGTEGRLVATLKMIDEDQAQSIARAIVDLYHALAGCTSADCREPKSDKYTTTQEHVSSEASFRVVKVREFLSHRL